MHGYEGVYYNLIFNMKVKHFSSITAVLRPLIELENTLKAVVRRASRESDLLSMEMGFNNDVFVFVKLPQQSWSRKVATQCLRLAHVSSPAIILK